MDKISAAVAFGKPVDIREELQDAIACCLHKLQSPIGDLIAVAELLSIGRKVPQHFTRRDDWPALEWVARRIINREQTKHRMQQMLDPDMIKLRPFAEFNAGPNSCLAANDLDGQFVQRDRISPLPFAGCGFASCCCWFRTRSRFEVERMAAKLGESFAEYVGRRTFKGDDKL